MIVGFIIGLITGINRKRRHLSNTTSADVVAASTADVVAASTADVVAASNMEDPTVYPEYEEIDLKSSQNVAYGMSLR